MIKETLTAYQKQHRSEHPTHYIWAGMNFTQCETCHDHAHYWKPGIMVRHNSDYSQHDRVDVTNHMQ